MTDIDLSTVPLSALTAEIKRRRDEWEAASKDLGFGVSAPVSIKRARHFTGKTTGGNPTMKAAANKRWAGWKEYKAQHPNADRKQFFKLKKSGKL
jgi:hypothetical protein